MKNVKCILGAMMAFLVAFPESGFSAESEYRLEQSARSLKSALDGRTVPLLKAKGPRGGAKLRMQKLVEALSASKALPANLKLVAKDGDSMLAAGDDGGYLEVDKDASSFRFRRGGESFSTQGSQERMSNSELESRGRAVLEKFFAPILFAGSSSIQETRFLGGRYIIDDVVELATGRELSNVVANIAVFGREVQGVSVVGPGSKAAIFLSPQGELIGFDVDWPDYKVLGKKQTSAPISEVADRFAKFSDRDVPLSGGTQSDDGSETHFVTLDLFECGYIDLGPRKRRGAKIQTGCAAQVSGYSGDGSVRLAYVEVLPIGVKVERDKSWVVTDEIRGRRPKPCRSKDPSCAEPKEAEDS